MALDNFDTQMKRLDKQLRSGAADRLSDAQHAAIEAAVLHRLRQVDPSAKHSLPASQRHWRPIALGVAAAAMVLIAVSVSMRPRHPQPKPLDLTSLAQVWQDVEYLTQRIPQWTSLPEQSIQAEMTRLTNDAQRSVAFLINCTPGSPLPKTENEY